MAPKVGTKRSQVQIRFNTECKRFSVPASRFEAAKADAHKWKATAIKDAWSQKAFGFKIADLEWKYNHHPEEVDSRESEHLQPCFRGCARHRFRCPASRACEIQLAVEHLQRATNAEGLQPAEIRFRWENHRLGETDMHVQWLCRLHRDQQILCTPVCDTCTSGYADFVRALQKGRHGNGGPAARTGNLYPITGTMRVRVQADRASRKG